jgi:hypothetical protein
VASGDGVPRLNGSHVVAGNGGPITVDDVEVCPIGTCASWFDDDRAIYQAGRDGRWTIETCDTRTGEIVMVSEQGCNELAAGGGRWAAWLAGRGVYGSAGDLPSAGLAPVGTDGRGAAGPDGTLAIVTDRWQGTGLALHAPDETLTWIPGGAPYGLRVLGPAQAVWNGGSIGIPSPQRRIGGQNSVRLVAPDGRVWWVEWLDPHGLVAYPDGSAVGHVISAGPAFHHDAIVVDGRLVVTYSSGVKELPGEIVTVPNVWALPSVSFDAPPVVVVPRIGHPCWLACFAGAPGAPGGWATNTPPWTLPGNGYLHVPDLRLYTMSGAPVAQYVAAEAEGTVEALDAAVREARKGGLPVMAYVPRALQGGRLPVCDVLLLEAYCRREESPQAFEVRMLKLLATVPDGQQIGLVAQAYWNDSLTDRLIELVPVYARLVKDDSQIIGVFPFSGSGRKGGLQDNPSLRPLWDQLAAGIPSAPPIHLVPIGEHKPPPPPPPPVEKDWEMSTLPGDKVEAWLEAAGHLAEPFILHDPHDPLSTFVQAKQGARELFDKINAAGQSPQLLTLVMGAMFRSGIKPVSDERMIVLVKDALAQQEELRR